MSCPPNVPRPTSVAAPLLNAARKSGGETQVDVIHRGGLAGRPEVIRPDLVADHAPVFDLRDPLPAVLLVDPHLLAVRPSCPVTGLEVDRGHARRPFHDDVHDRLRPHRCQTGAGTGPELESCRHGHCGSDEHEHTQPTPTPRTPFRLREQWVEREGQTRSAQRHSAIIASTTAYVKDRGSSPAPDGGSSVLSKRERELSQLASRPSRSRARRRYPRRPTPRRLVRPLRWSRP